MPSLSVGIGMAEMMPDASFAPSRLTEMVVRTMASGAVIWMAGTVTSNVGKPFSLMVSLKGSRCACLYSLVANLKKFQTACLRNYTIGCFRFAMHRLSTTVNG